MFKGRLQRNSGSWILVELCQGDVTFKEVLLQIMGKN